MSEVPGGDADATPNLTPMLDMVFQLITFFMLVINFKSASMDLTLKLPVVGSARPVDSQGTQELLVLNVDSEGALKVYGITRPVENYIAGEAQASRLVAKPTMSDEEIETKGLPTVVVIRADRSTEFRLLNRVIKACQENGFRQFALKAMNKDG
jgi:biopolymer transport protein ExbD